MAYEFKKLSEVEKLDSVPDGASVLAEVDGVIRRVPGSGLGGGGSTRETIFAEQTVEGFAADEIDGGLYAANAISSAMLVVGEEYTVAWDGESYSCVAQDVSSLEAGFVAMGNGSNFGFSGNDEPFIILTNYIEEDDAVFIGMLAVDGSTAPSHTVAIYKEAASSGGVSSWNDLTDKPFGEETGVIFEGTFQDVLEDTNGDGTNDAWEGIAFIEDTSDATLIVGKNYTVTWDGVEYECKCFIAEGLPVVGNAIVMGGTNNGAPFVIARDTVNLYGVGKAWIASLVESPTDLTISGTYSCKIVLNDVKTINPEYLPIPFFGDVRTDIFPETTATFELNTSFNAYMSAFVFDKTLPMFPLAVGDECIVAWDGVDYNVTVGDASAILPDTLYIGNGTAFGLSGNGEPFIAGWTSGDVFVASTVDTEAKTHTFSIYQNIKSLDNKYLDFMDKTERVETEIMAEQTVEGFVDCTNYYEAIISSEEVTFTIIPFEKYKVVWDGEEYECTAYIRSLSNGEVYTMGYSSFQPFFIMYYPDDAAHFHTASSTATSHTVAIYHVTGEEDVIKPETLPGPPYFDLTAMGLPAVPLDGTTVSVECDTTEFRAAAAKGLIKTKIYISVPGFGDMPVENLVPMAYLIPTNTYAYSGLFILDNTPFIISCSANNNGIHASALPLMTATT